MYHVELRQFPHNVCRFNLCDGQMRAIVEPWARAQWIELGERRWDPSQARLTVLEGPELALDQLTMGRGWRAAQRRSEDVTERVIAAARQAGVGAGREEGATRAQVDVRSASMSTDPLALAVQMAALLGPDPMHLLDAWRAAAGAAPTLAPSESLARAEEMLRTGGSA